MDADHDLTKAERKLVWQQLEAVLPSALTVLHDALRCRVMEGAGNPLRNFLIRKLLVGIHDSAPLVREFETGLALLRNQDAFMAGIAGRKGAEFDSRLQTWRAEMRALGFLHHKRAVVAATAIAPARKRKRPDFIVHRASGDGLTEVKLVSPNDNYCTIEEELEIAAIRWPEVFRPWVYAVRYPDDRTITLSEEHLVLATFIRKLRHAIGAGQGKMSHAWVSTERRACELAVVEMTPSDDFGIVGEPVDWRLDPSAHGHIDQEFREHWLAPLAHRLRDKGDEALLQMRCYEEETGTIYPEKDIVIHYYEPGGSPAALLLPEECAPIKASAAARLKEMDAGTVLSVIP